ncbi:hypothetical protein [Nocardioides convexus]|nr:hypothetical protein [Nocardioides convexus]
MTSPSVRSWTRSASLLERDPASLREVYLPELVESRGRGLPGAACGRLGP